MMKKILLFTLFTCITLFTNAQVQKGLEIGGEGVYDLSGNSVSLSADGNVVAIGAPGNDGNGNDAGHVRVYSWDGFAWVQLGTDIDGEAADDESGCSLSMSADGNVVAIGAEFNDGNGSASGHVRVYSWDGSDWLQVGVDIDGESSWSTSGYSVSMSADGNTVAIGSPRNDVNGSDAGLVRVYTWDGSAWVQLGTDLYGEAVDDFSGISVSISANGNTVAIGAEKNDGNGNNAGHVRVYNWDGSVWSQLGIDIDGEAADDFSGGKLSVSADGSILAIGAINNAGNGAGVGHVRVYSWDGIDWFQLGSDIDGEGTGDGLGYSVSLSADGNTVAIGAPGNDQTGHDAGHVRVYTWDGSDWVQLGIDIDGEAADDLSGCSLSISADGNTVAIGARYNDGNGSSSGHVRVYNLAGPTNHSEYISIDNFVLKQLLKITDVLGRESKSIPNTPLFYRYDDGVVEKIIVVE